MLENFRLHVFRSVARHLNFSRAAQELFLTQPAVTQQIKALEEELGVPLFDRGAGRIRLTPGGEALLPFALQLKDLSSAAVKAVGLATGQQVGALAIGASQTIGQYLLPTLVAGFVAAWPRVAVTAISGNTDQMLAALLDKKIHIALVEGPEHRKDLRIEPFMQDQLVLVVPADHPWAGNQVEPATLGTEPLLMREFGSGSRRVVEQALQLAGLRLKDLHLGMELDSTEALLSGVEAGLGVTFVSQWAVRNQLTLGTLRLARVKGLVLARQFSLAYPAGPAPSGPVGAFRSFLLSQIMQLAPRTTGRARPRTTSSKKTEHQQP